MKTIKMSLENVRGKMSRSEMKNILGGGGCCVTSVSSSHGNHYWGCGYTKGEAVSLATDIGEEGEYRGYWCCSSC